MEKIFISILILYALFVAISLLRIRAMKKRKKDIVGKGGSILKTERLKTDIIGKSTFDISHSKPLTSKSTPLAANSPKSEKSTENTDIFAASDEVNLSAEVPQEELDEAFSDTPAEEDNEPMDIDYPLEYETADDDPEGEEEETKEVEGTAQAALASGVQFEDLGNAVRTVNRTAEATPEQKKKAGATLLEVRRTDMFEQLVSGNGDKQKTVAELMAESLAAFHRRKDKESGNTGNGRKVPESFNIRDFA